MLLFKLAYCVSQLSLLWKNTQENLYKGRELNFVSWLQRFPSMVTGPFALGLWLAHYMIVQELWLWGPDHFIETMKHKGREEGTRFPIVPPRILTQWPYFLPLGPTSQKLNYFPVVIEGGEGSFNTGAFGAHWISKPLCFLKQWFIYGICLYSNPHTILRISVVTF